MKSREITCFRTTIRSKHSSHGKSSCWLTYSDRGLQMRVGASGAVGLDMQPRTHEKLLLLLKIHTF